MSLIPPSQIAALCAAAASSSGSLSRTSGPRGAGYSPPGEAGELHSPRATIALAREGLLAEASPGFQSVYLVTEAGRRVAAANVRAKAVAA